MLCQPMSVDMALEMPLEKAEICSWMYIKKVSDDHRPCFRMAIASQPFRCMAMAPPARREMAAHCFQWETSSFEVQCHNSCFYRLVDMSVQDMVAVAVAVEKGGNDVVITAMMASDVVNAAGQGADWARKSVIGLMVYAAAAADAILLIRNM